MCRFRLVLLLFLPFCREETCAPAFFCLAKRKRAAPGGERKGAYFGLQGSFSGLYSFLVWNWLSPFGAPCKRKLAWGEDERRNE